MNLTTITNQSGVKKQLSNIDYFCFFVIVVYAAMAVPATKSMIKPEGGGLVVFLIPWSLILFLILRHKVSFNNKVLFGVLLAYFVWVLLQTLSIGTFYMGSGIFFGNIIIAYLLIKIYSFKMFFLYERVVVIWSVFALIFWILHVVVPGPFEAMMRATSIYDFPPGGTILSHNIVYSLSNTAREGASFLPRNAGFSWEPGRYSSMLAFAMFFNVVRTKFVLTKNLSFWILVAAIITSQSTTGLSAMFIILLMVFTNKAKRVKLLAYLLALIPCIASIVYLPFMGDKISNLWFNQDNRNEQLFRMEYYMREGQEVILVPQRFDSMAYHFENFKDQPLLGYGIEPKNSYVQRELSPFIWPTGGIILLFSRFGLLIGFFAYVYLYKSSEWFSNKFGYDGKWWLFALFTLLSISYSFWFVPVFMSLWMYTLFDEDDEINIEHEQTHKSNENFLDTRDLHKC